MDAPRTIEEYEENLKNAILGKLVAENAADMSDAEIDRCLAGVGENMRIKAKAIRDSGFMTIREFNDMWNSRRRREGIIRNAEQMDIFDNA